MVVLQKSYKIKNKKKTAFRGRFSPIGLDLGSSMLKMVQLRQNRGNISVSCNYIGRISGEAFENGLPVEQDLLAHKINNIIKNKGFNGRTVNISLNPSSFYYRTVRMPNLSKAELKKAMYWEALNNFPISDDKMIIDYCPVNILNGDQQDGHNYILAATSNNTANIYTGITEKAGLICSALEIEPLSLIRAVLPLPGQQVRTINLPLILVNIGYSNTVLLFLGSSKIFYRSIKIGTLNFIKALQEINGCSMRIADEILFVRKTPLNKELMAIAHQLILKIGQSLDAWFDQEDQSAHGLHQIYFCGGGAFIPSLAAELENHLQIKCSLYSPLAGLDNLNCDNNKSHSTKKIFFPVAYGLALRGWVS